MNKRQKEQEILAPLRALWELIDDIPAYFTLTEAKKLIEGYQSGRTIEFRIKQNGEMEVKGRLVDNDTAV